MHAGEQERVLAEMAAEASAFEASGDAERLAFCVKHAMPARFVRHILVMDRVTARSSRWRGGDRGGDLSGERAAPFTNGMGQARVNASALTR